jgi:hypothetical protein
MDKLLQFFLTQFIEMEIDEEILLEFLGIFKQGLITDGNNKELVIKINKILIFFIKYKETIKINNLYFNFSVDIFSPS